MPMLSALIAEDTCTPATEIAVGQSAPRAVADAITHSTTGAIAVESASGARLTEIESDWRDLIGRALEPNVFMHPAMIRSAERHLACRCATLLAWRGEGEAKKLIGLWAFAVVRPPHLPLASRVLLSPAFPHGYLATPVVDRAAAADALEAMLDFIARARDLPKTIALDPIRADGPTMQALERVLRARGSAAFAVAEAKRPVLASELDGTQYFEKALSSSSRKKLRQHRRRLGEKGALTLEVCSAPEAVDKAFEEYLALEAAGWKGRRGSAILCDPAETGFVRDMIVDLARRGDASIHALYLDGKPVSMQIVLRAGPVAFTWKTAYDEAMHDFSPGMLLLEDYTKAFLADASIAQVDSCAFDESSFMVAWSERQVIAQVWLDARRGRSWRLFLLSRLQKAYLNLRAVAKQRYLSWRRKWKSS